MPNKNPSAYSQHKPLQSWQQHYPDANKPRNKWSIKVHLIRQKNTMICANDVTITVHSARVTMETQTTVHVH